MKIPQEKYIKGITDNITISPLFKAGVRYNIDSNSPKYQQEDENGTLMPAYDHCYLNWESIRTDDEGNKFISKEAEFYKHLDDAEDDANQLKKYIK